MTEPTKPPGEIPREKSLATLWCCLGIVGAVFAAYGRGFGFPFVYDDVDSVLRNPSIRQWATALRPPPGLTVTGRPILNLSFAFNYAVAGTSVWGYHALNALIHAGAALLLFGLVRRTLEACRPLWSKPERAGVAFAIALLWAVHPLQTESVAYVVQRAESLMGFFYLLALYGFIRLATGGGDAGIWAVISSAACLLGMGTKEVMVTAPVVILLYDRAFVGGSFREAWRSRKGLYLTYAGCWIPLAVLVGGTSGRGGSAGFGSGVPWWAYAFTQLTAIVRYIGLALWPHPLVGDYGRILAGSPLHVALCALLILGLVAATCVLLKRNSPVGFLGACFFLILAPSSSVVPVSTEIMAEHRMYLSLAAIIALLVLGLSRILGRTSFFAALGIAAVLLGILTARRIQVYTSSFTFWSDVATQVPANAGAWNNLGIILAEKGDQEGAIEHYQRALAVAPAYAYAHYNLGNSLMETGRSREAVGEYEAALKYRPDDASIHFNLGNALAREKREPEAVVQFRETIRIEPDRSDAWFNLADALMQAGDLQGSADSYAHAVQLRPAFADARVNYGNVLAQLGRYTDAVRELGQALKLEPGAADIHNNLGGVLAEAGRLAEARSQFEEALRLKPDYAEARDNLERVRVLEQAREHP